MHFVSLRAVYLAPQRRKRKTIKQTKTANLTRLVILETTDDYELLGYDSRSFKRYLSIKRRACKIQA